jgi:hypothetical protein
LRNIGEESFEELLKLWLSENALLLGGEIDYSRIAEELLGLAAISAIGIAGAIQAVTDHMEELFRDIPRALALTTAVRNKFLEVNRG